MGQKDGQIPFCFPYLRRLVVEGINEWGKKGGPFSLSSFT